MLVTRFAPSPTGFLHLGGARTALYNWLMARRYGGRMILRIEDTDTERSTGASVTQILDSLGWLGIDWDEGPYFQSERLALYREHLARLIEKDAVYPAFETMAELEEARNRALAERRNPRYDGPSRHLSRAEARRRMEAGERHVWRFRTPSEGVTEVEETLMSADGVSFANADIEDFAITRPAVEGQFGMPLYNFCCVVDDALMKISHVIRGVEHLSNTPKQVLLYRAFGYATPLFSHLPLILKNNKKMSKRDADADPMHPVSVSARRDLGYLPEATSNFIALLGWSHPESRELFDMAELVRTFSVDRLGRSNANFDESKYLHTNAFHLRQKPLDELVALVVPFLDRAGLSTEGRDAEWLRRIVELERERCRLLSEFPAALRFFFEAPASYDPKGAQKFLNSDGGRRVIGGMMARLASLPDFDVATLEAAVRQFAEAHALSLGDVSQPLRVALTGRTASPGLFDVLAGLGRDEALARLERAQVAFAAP